MLALIIMLAWPEGQPVGEAGVLQVQKAEVMDRTGIIWLEVPKELGLVVRNIRVGGDTSG